MLRHEEVGRIRSERFGAAHRLDQDNYSFAGEAGLRRINP